MWWPWDKRKIIPKRSKIYNVYIFNNGTLTNANSLGLFCFSASGNKNNAHRCWEVTAWSHTQLVRYWCFVPRFSSRCTRYPLASDSDTQRFHGAAMRAGCISVGQSQQMTRGLQSKRLHASPRDAKGKAWCIYHRCQRVPCASGMTEGAFQTQCNNAQLMICSVPQQFSAAVSKCQPCWTFGKVLLCLHWTCLNVVIMTVLHSHFTGFSTVFKHLI